MSQIDQTNPPGDTLQALEQWLDGDGCKPDGEEPLANRLEALRRTYRNQRYLGPAPEARTGVRQVSAWWRPATIAGVLALALVAVLVIHPTPGPRPGADPEAGNNDWVADSAGARLRALRADLQAGVNAPPKPAGLRFTVPQRPQRVSGFADQVKNDADGGDPQTYQHPSQGPAAAIS